jgi:hypothetical protein
MVSFPASMEFEAGLTFTIGAITWTTAAAMTAETVEAVQPDLAPASSTTSPTSPILGSILGSSSSTTRRQLPRYQGKALDNADLIESIDRLGGGLAEALSLAGAAQALATEDGFTTVHHRRR